MINKKWGGLLVIVVLAAIAVGGCGAKESTTEAVSEKTVPVEVTAAYIGNVEITSSYQGNILPSMDVNVVPKIGGKVAQVNVKDGDQVQAGDVLLRLDATEISAQIAQAEAAYMVAGAQLEKVKAGTRAEQLEQLKAGVAQAAAGLTNAENNLSAAQTNYDRMKLLYEQGAVSKQQFEQAENGLKSAEVGLETSKAMFKQAQESLAMAENGASAQDVKSAEAQVAQAGAALKLARTQLDNTVITAPISGTVSSVALDSGEMAGPGIPVAVINQLDTVEVHVELTERDVNSIKQGQLAEVLVPAASGDPFQGKVVNVSPVADPRTKTYLMKVDLDNKDGLLKAGMSATVKAIVAAEKEVTVIPVEAVIDGQGEQVVFVVENETANRRPLVLGIGNSADVAVRKGVTPGEKVVIAGQYNLKDGDQVRVAGGGEQ